MAQSYKNSRAARWSLRAKAIGLSQAKKMSGFPVSSLLAWVRRTYGPCTITTSHVQEAAPNDHGDMIVIPGSDKIFLNMEIEFQQRPDHDANIQQMISQKLYDLGAKYSAPFSMSVQERDGVTHAKVTYMLGNVELA